MHFTTSALLLAASTLTTAQTYTNSPSTKRGLVFVPNSLYPGDNQVWVQPGSDLTWYYNYGVQPSPAYANRSQEEFEFVPMLWSPTTTFLSDVTALIKGGRNISHILAYNEPDGTAATGGSNITPEVAAANWISQIEPLRKLGVKTGAPAVTAAGATWLQEFFAACASQGTNCTADFFPVHSYDNWGGLSYHITTMHSNYPDAPVWVTEYAYSNQTLEVTQDFFNQSASYMDNLTYVDRYAWFGTFRTEVSNVGPNAAFLNNQGKLTDMGEWWVGKAATGVQPGGSSSAAGRNAVEMGLGLVAAAVVGLLAL
ncbi:hypothetical protein G7Y89_g8913 [Cudoniella acicularis]|uniref:Asl1-like glycosyl hydrolase catalytic domain-containing protein n=1 Tax=Cudoniella acicularis TaxID=354080 RepID=A0A8H4RHV4_9HELO|nr:hypothetical protein G7Y89_g8913 [Cudoniella acicularis]